MAWLVDSMSLLLEFWEKGVFALLWNEIYFGEELPCPGLNCTSIVWVYTTDIIDFWLTLSTSNFYASSSLHWKNAPLGRTHLDKTKQSVKILFGYISIVSGYCNVLFLDSIEQYLHIKYYWIHTYVKYVFKKRTFKIEFLRSWNTFTLWMRLWFFFKSELTYKKMKSVSQIPP